MEVQVYTKTDCPFCVQTKQWFKEFNIDIIEHNLDNEEERLSFFQNPEPPEASQNRDFSIIS